MPRFEREQNSDHRQHRSSGQIGDLNSRERGRTILRADQIEHSRQCQIINVVTGERREFSFAAVAGERRIDQARVLRVQHVPADAQTIHHVGPEAFDDHIGR